MITSTALKKMSDDHLAIAETLLLLKCMVSAGNPHEAQYQLLFCELLRRNKADINHVTVLTDETLDDMLRELPFNTLLRAESVKRQILKEA